MGLGFRFGLRRLVDGAQLVEDHVHLRTTETDEFEDIHELCVGIIVNKRERVLGLSVAEVTGVNGHLYLFTELGQNIQTSLVANSRSRIFAVL